MSKTDTDLQSDVKAELAWDPSVQAQDVTVTVKEGIVTLTGSVFTFAEKLSAEAAVRRVTGVRGIAEELSVNLLGVHQRNDGDIASAIATGLDWNTRVPKGSVTALVEDGAVVLGGTVEWNCERVAAYQAVHHILGVKSISNQILVKFRPADATDIKNKIAAALKRLVRQDSAGIQVRADHGRVVLDGTVHSWTEHDEATRSAWSAPGVTDVENDLVVVY